MQDFSAAIQQFSDDNLLNYVSRANGDSLRLGFNFSCINPVGHPGGDSRPSANIFKAKDGHLWYHCYSCGLHGNLINIYRTINPAMQAEKVTTIMKNIASEIGCRPAELPASKEVSPIIRAYKIASTYVKECSDLAGHLKSRGIDKATAEKFAIGSVPSFDAFTDHMTKYFKYEELKEFGLANVVVFNENNIIMTIHNRQGMPVAFVARNCGVVDDKRPKYCNTKTTDIYSKSDTLFLFHDCKSASIEAKSLYIVEGYIDAVTLHRNNILNSCAMGGVALTHQHIEMAKSLGVNEIVFSWDNDPVGVKTTLRKVSEIFGDCKGIRIRFIVVPTEYKDADGIITAKGKQAFLDLPKLDLLEYMATVLRPEPEDKDLALYFETIYDHLRYVSLNPFKIPDYVRLLHIATKLPEANIKIALSHEAYKMQHISDQYETTLEHMIIDREKPEIPFRGTQVILDAGHETPCIDTKDVLGIIWDMTSADTTIHPIIIGCAKTYIKMAAQMTPDHIKAAQKMHLATYYIHDTDDEFSLEIIKDIREKYKDQNYVIFLDIFTVGSETLHRVDMTRVLLFNPPF